MSHYPAGAGFALQPSPACVFAGAGAWLDARGMRVDSRVACWWRALDNSLPGPNPGIRIADVTPADAARFAELCAGIFGHPPIWPILTATIGRPGWRHFVALDDGRPVATGTLYVRGDVAWLGAGGTVVTHRGRGVQSAMIAHRLATARTMGATWARCDTAEDLPEAPNPSFRNVRRAGFTLEYHRPRHAHVTPGGSPG